MLFLIIKNYLHFDHLNNRYCFIKNTLLFRSVLSFIISFLLLFIITPYLIIWFKQFNIQQNIRNNGPQSHLSKNKTPTMGGILIIFSIITSILLCSNLSNLYIIYSIIILIAYGIIGFLDDYKKIYYHSSKGLCSLHKFILLSIVTIIIISFIYHLWNSTVLVHKIIFPGYHHIITFHNKIAYGVLVYLTIVGTSNAINLTDGLDGLAVVPIIFVTIGFMILIFISSNKSYSNYFNILFIPNIYELTIFCSAIIGSSLGFLWFNTYPAKIFMGDVGSLALGGTLGMLSVLLGQEFFLLITGGLFVIETLSVIIQILYFKYTKKRFFNMTPIHHHYELQGCPEPRLVVRCWIISFVFMLLGLILIGI